MCDKNKELKDKELEEVNGGVIPIIFAEQNKTSVIESVPLIKPEGEKSKEEKNVLVPIPY